MKRDRSSAQGMLISLDGFRDRGYADLRLSFPPRTGKHKTMGIHAEHESVRRRHALRDFSHLREVDAISV